MSFFVAAWAPGLREALVGLGQGDHVIINGTPNPTDRFPAGQPLPLNQPGLRAEPAVFEPVASDPTVSQLIDALPLLATGLRGPSGPRGPEPADVSGGWPADTRRRRTGRRASALAGCR